jgi:hypothetical protein
MGIEETVVNAVKPYARAFKYALLRNLAARHARKVSLDSPDCAKQPLAFIIGCGRSGTSILGKTLAQHPDVDYLFEPGHLWSAVDPITDTTHLHSVAKCKFILDACDCTSEARRRFNQLFLKPAHRAGAALVLEKTPVNTARIGYLECLKDDARYIHIVRDGVDVARSIARLSMDQTYRIAGQPDRSRWWGRNSSKWNALAQDGAVNGYFTDEIPLIDNFLAKGAYEWLVSLGEVNRWRKHLGPRLLEIKYEFFTTQPRESIAAICDFLDIRHPGMWLNQFLPRISPPRHNEGLPILLPPAMCEAFNDHQSTYGFTPRAQSTASEKHSFQKHPTHDSHAIPSLATAASRR